jgi:hypothetical protein
MPKKVRRSRDASFLGVQLDDLLDTSGGELRSPFGLEQVAVVSVGSDVSFQRHSERPTKQNVAVSATFPLVHEYLAVFKIHLCHLDVA